MPFTPDALLERLDQLEIPHKTHHHPAVFTVEEARIHQHNIEGAHSKNLFFKDKKKNLFLVVTLADKPIRIKEVAKTIGAKHLSFASPQLLMEVLGVPPGSVTPLSAVNIRDHEVRIILDKEMMDQGTLNFHPLVNTATTTIDAGDLILFLEDCGQRAEVIQL